MSSLRDSPLAVSGGGRRPRPSGPGQAARWR